LEEEFKYRVNIKGYDYKNGVSLSDSIEILRCFCEIYTYCLERATNKFAKDELLIYQPIIKLEYAKKGSFDTISWIDFPAAFAMIKPLIGSYSWDLFKNTFEFINLVVSKSVKKEVPLQVAVINSPGSTNIVVVGNNNTINVGSDIFASAKRNYEYVADLAKKISFGRNSRLEIARVGERKKPIDSITVTPKTKDNYIAEVREITSDELVEVKCKIYKLNLKSGKGSAEIVDENIFEKSVNFEIIGFVGEKYIEALKMDIVTVVGRLKLLISPFGEKKIQYIYVSDVIL
jgi:hypothetical protein